MPNTIRAYLIDAKHCAAFAFASQFWHTLQSHAKLIDSLPSKHAESMSLLPDHAAESRMLLPVSWMTDTGTRISPPDGVQVVTILTPHAAKVMGSRLAKRRSTLSPSVIPCFDFIARQTENFASEEQRILITVEDEVPVWDE